MSLAQSAGRSKKISTPAIIPLALHNMLGHSHSMERHITTIVDVIDVLGGREATANLTGRTPNAVTNWRAFGEFPPSTYLVIGDALRKLGFSASVGLWGFDKGHEDD